MSAIDIRKWKTNKNIQLIFKILEKNGEETRFIGGCVRDLIVKRKKNYDIDLATTLKPNVVIKLLKKKKIKIIKPGFSHGTVIAIINKEKFEITTLRKDIQTDGRHAKVKFTSDFLTDSIRRDFTINAMSCDIKGTLYDYHGGIRDLKKGEIKFIGDSKERIKEDFLRILRFFRFYAYYGKKKITQTQLKIFKNLSKNLKKLSSERIYSEFYQILLSDNQYDVIKLMNNSGVLKYLIFNDNNIERLKSLNKLIEINHLIDFSTRLAILMNKKNLNKISKNLKLSKDEVFKIKKILSLHKNFDFKDFKKNKTKYIYYYGYDECLSLLIFNFANFPNKFNSKDYLKIILSLKNLKIPNLPISGKDIIKLGVKSGPKVGKILELIESWWVLNNFKPSKKECVERLKDYN
ncbi:MAG: CCA-adding enzyme [Alphaproteobacteria bacterium MarineAlpha6_Bin4]|nr:MAG: CCA-adding enzyme [Alphaproteobacteria bacterium MarineAlpha6_Bin3]PPR38106.1 MAG: CCA-adding enzyme [Alphaproteobacteria bacterium MarineAlpha6_Bin4]|tara:strand:- start:17539 stop:18756 length:1218 start_codon:yes stop_codon:yes gene_type:complete